MNLVNSRTVRSTWWGLPRHLFLPGHRVVSARRAARLANSVVGIVVELLALRTLYDATISTSAATFGLILFSTS